MITIRKTGPEGIPAIREICLKVWPQTYQEIIPPGQIGYMLDMMYSEQALTKQMEEHGHQFLIAYREGVPSGYASFSPKTGEPEVYRLHKLYVDLSCQGKGIGTQLIEVVLAEIITRGAKVLELNVNKYNRAKDYYISRGFSIYRDEVLEIGNGFVMDDHVMRKTLDGH